MSHFDIRCRKCNKILVDTYCAFCEHCVDSLLLTEFKEKEFSALGPGEGIWKFNWIPVHSPMSKVPAPLVYRSEGLADSLGLRNLHIIFNGYWPERGAMVESCTFKEYEAAMVLENARENNIEGLVVASAGNTARAFAHFAHKTSFPAIIVVPLMCLEEMWYLEYSDNVPTFVVSDGDYSDAIDMARRIALTSGMPFEGGVKNIAKRDGLGVVFLEAVSVMGRLPDHHFQAVGSGAGAIAAWEMSERFQSDERYRGIMPKLHLAQNLPFAPMVKAWKRGERTLRDEELNPALISEISTRVLSTRYPAYSTLGGVFDALRATEGHAYGVTNEEASTASKLFKRTEGMDIVPAAAVAVGALMQSVKMGNVDTKDNILINITGGGESNIRAEGRMNPVKGIFISKKSSDAELKEAICKTLNKTC
jgi:cysteate synthase